MISLLFPSAVICGGKGPCEHGTVRTVTKSLGSALLDASGGRWGVGGGEHISASSLTSWTVNVCLCLFWTLMIIPC